MKLPQRFVFPWGNQINKWGRLDCQPLNKHKAANIYPAPVLVKSFDEDLEFVRGAENMIPSIQSNYQTTMRS